jgi:hypothetical protein
MKHRSFLMTLVVIAFGGSGNAVAQIKAPGAVTCTGPFSKHTSHAALAAAFGSKNVASQDIEGFEGVSVPASVVFPNDKKRRLEFIWKDDKAQRELGAIWIEDESRWTSPGGAVRLGMSIEEVEAKNGKPFKLTGFIGDADGLVKDWQGGALARIQGGCRISLRFEPEPGVQMPDSILGDNTLILSSDPDVRAAKPVVAQIFITYPN